MKGAIAAGHPLSARAGADVLEAGGNAVDALLAALFTAFVVEGPLTGPAGGGFLLELARGGFTRDEQRAFLHRILVPILLRDEGGRRVYGDPTRVVTDDIEETLVAISERGAAAVADLVPEYADDIAAYEVRESEPLEARIAGYEVFSTPPPSRGGGVVLRILER